MTNVHDSNSARAAALSIRRRLDSIQGLLQSSRGLVRLATSGNGDSIAFWNDGSKAMEYNISEAQRRLTAIAAAYPDAVRSRSGQVMNFRIELPLR